jgi:hypothetical protein
MAFSSRCVIPGFSTLDCNIDRPQSNTEIWQNEPNPSKFCNVHNGLAPIDENGAPGPGPGTATSRRITPGFRQLRIFRRMLRTRCARSRSR